jgi:anti-sigma factor RsiW
MNTESIHSRAECLIAQDLVEGIAESDRRWLEQHLRECDRCSASAAATGSAVRALKSVRIPVPEGLARRAQFRVQLRAQEQRDRRMQRGFLWIACAASWLFGAASAPYVWSALQSVGQRLAVPHLVPEVGFGLWWALPAIVAGAIVLAENARYRRQRDWSA